MCACEEGLRFKWALQKERARAAISLSGAFRLARHALPAIRHVVLSSLNSPTRDLLKKELQA